MNKRFASILAATLCIGFLGAAFFIGSVALAQNQNVVGDIEWVQQVGEGLIAPACGSASPPPLTLGWTYTCGADNQPDITFRLTRNDTSTCFLTVPLTLNVVRESTGALVYTITKTSPGPNCDDWYHTWSNGVQGGERYLFRLRSPSDHVIAQNAFAAPVCIPPTPPPTTDIRANNSSGPITITAGQGVIVEWCGPNQAPCANANTCTVWGENEITGQWFVVDAGPHRGGRNQNPMQRTRYHLSCTGPGGSSSDSVLVNVNVPPPPEADIRANGSNGPITITSGSNVNIRWCGADAHNCANATSCLMRKNGGLLRNAVSGTHSEVLNASANYTLSCTNGAGVNVNDSVQVNVSALTPPTSPQNQNIACNVTGTLGNFSWTSPASGPPDRYEYRINSGAWFSNGTNQSVGFATTPGSTYTGQVRACNAAGCGPSVSDSVTCPSPGHPNLRILSFVLPNGSPGQTVNASVTVQNNGAAATAGGFEVAINRDAGTMNCSTTEHGQVPTGALGIGASRALTIPVTLPASTGNHTAVAMVDSDCAVAESNEGDNTLVDFYTVASPATLSVTLSANPPSGNAPLNSVALSGNVAGTATGNILYSFDCTNDGIYEHTSPLTAQDPYTVPAPDRCNYANPGNYTARVRVIRGGLFADDTVNIPVNLPPFSYTLQPIADLTLEQGWNFDTTQVDLTLDSGISQNITLSINGLPAGATGVFDNSPCQPDCSNNLRIDVSPAVPVGTYPLTVTANPGGQSQTFDLVVTNASQPNPAANLSDAQNYCQLPWAFIFSWDYSHTAGKDQKAYRIQLSQDAAFGSVAYDSCPADDPSDPSCQFGAQHGDSVSLTKSFTGAQLGYGNPYYWRVKVWDIDDVASAWSATANPAFSTPVHDLPQVDFTFVPPVPSAGQEVQFTDQTIFAGGGPVNYAWDFGGFGDPNTSSAQNPLIVFTRRGAHTVTLSVTDSAGSCSVQKVMQAKPPLPGYIEK